MCKINYVLCVVLLILSFLSIGLRDTNLFVFKFLFYFFNENRLHFFKMFLVQ